MAVCLCVLALPQTDDLAGVHPPSGTGSSLTATLKWEEEGRMIYMIQITYLCCFSFKCFLLEISSWISKCYMTSCTPSSARRPPQACARPCSGEFAGSIIEKFHFPFAS